jgi:hypothetical protein
MSRNAPHNVRERIRRISHDEKQGVRRDHRNFGHDVPIRLGVGPQQLEPPRRIIAGPSAFSLMPAVMITNVAPGQLQKRRMTMIQILFVATAIAAACSISAHADELSDLKEQLRTAVNSIQSLQERVRISERLS